MTSRTNARIAGAAFIVYFAAGVSSLTLLSAATKGGSVSESLRTLAASAISARLTILLTFVQACCALCLAVTLYSLTRGVDRDIALLGLAFRFAEGISGVTITRTLGLLWLATDTNLTELTPDVKNGLGLSLLQMGPWQPNAAFLAVGSLLFCWLLVRGRLVAPYLAWLGVVASALLVALIPLQLSGVLDAQIEWGGSIGILMWVPMLVFEAVVAVVLIARGVRPLVHVTAA